MPVSFSLVAFVAFVAFVDFVLTAHIDYVDFCHDSAKQVNLMALAAPSVRPSENKFSWCSLNRSLAFTSRCHIVGKSTLLLEAAASLSQV